MTAEAAVSTAQRLVSMFEHDRRRIQAEFGRVAGSALRVHAALQERPLTTLPEICRRTGLSHPAASAMKLLVSHRVAQEVTGRKRDRIFTYRDHLAILSEGTDAL